MSCRGHTTKEAHLEIHEDGSKKIKGSEVFYNALIYIPLTPFHIYKLVDFSKIKKKDLHGYDYYDYYYFALP